MASSRKARDKADAFALWTRFTVVTVVGSVALTWLFLLVLKSFQS